MFLSVCSWAFSLNQCNHVSEHKKPKGIFTDFDWYIKLPLVVFVAVVVFQIPRRQEQKKIDTNKNILDTCTSKLFYSSYLQERTVFYMFVVQNFCSVSECCFDWMFKIYTQDYRKYF